MCSIFSHFNPPTGKHQVPSRYLHLVPANEASFAVFTVCFKVGFNSLFVVQKRLSINGLSLELAFYAGFSYFNLYSTMTN